MMPQSVPNTKYEEEREARNDHDQSASTASPSWPSNVQLPDRAAAMPMHLAA